MIDRETVDRIYAAANIVDIIGEFGAEKYVAAYAGGNHHFAVGCRPAAERAAFFFLFCHLSV